MRDDAQRIVADYSDLIVRLSYTYLHSRHDALDICQDVLIKALMHEEPWESSEHEKAWMIRVTINACKSELAKANRSKTVALEDASRLAAPAEEASEVLDAVARLPLEQREATYLHYYEGYKIEKIALMTGRSYAAVAKALSRARKKLRTMLED